MDTSPTLRLVLRYLSLAVAIGLVVGFVTGGAVALARATAGPVGGWTVAGLVIALAAWNLRRAVKGRAPSGAQ